MERIHLSEHFNYKKLFQFVLPSIIMMVFISVYGIVDGFFVSNFAGELPFAALNLIYPLIMILGAVGFMLGTGGNAVVSKALGEGDSARANRYFSMLIYATVVIGVVLSICGMLVVRPVAKLFASAEQNMSDAERAELIDWCVIYARIILAALPMFMIQNAFQGFFVTAEKSRLGLYVTVMAGVCNIILDAMFVVGFQGGLVGAAIATALSQVLGGVLPSFYFFRKNDSLLRLGKTRFEPKVFGKVCVNGLSELLSNISLSVVTILYNAQLMRYVGIKGVSAYGIMMYIGFIFIAVFIGYSIGVSPIVGYDYGAQNKKELKNIFTKSVVFSLIAGIVMTALACLFATPLSRIFVRDDRELLALTTRGLRIYSLCFLLTGLNIFASSFFTALSNGTLSLLISFFRTFLCQVAAVLLLPLLLEVDGIWLAAFMAELITMFLTVSIVLLNKKRYGYL
ncbi:MAG: MATE family efflux transporter [Clostridiales bacterium]|nr:MATE family efflux transporter [Clostridiales bacterium]